MPGGELNAWEKRHVLPCPFNKKQDFVWYEIPSNGGDFYVLQCFVCERKTKQHDVATDAIDNWNKMVPRLIKKAKRLIELCRDCEGTGKITCEVCDGSGKIHKRS